MGIYKPGRPNKYNPSTGGGSKPPSSPGEYRIRDNSGKCATSVKPATLIAVPTSIEGPENSPRVRLLNTRSQTADPPLLRGESMSAVR